MLHAQPSATTSSLCLLCAILGSLVIDVPSTSADRRSWALPHCYSTTTYPAYIHTHVQIQIQRIQTQPSQLRERAEPTPDDRQRSLSCSPGNIIIIPKQHTQPDPLACSLVRWLAPTHPHPHHTARNTPAEAAEQNTPIGSVFIYCTSTVFPACSLTAWLACICVPYLYQTPHRTTTCSFPRHPSLDTCSYKTAPGFPFSRPDLLLLAVQRTRTSITRLAPRPCLFDPFTRPLSQKGALIPLPNRGRAFLTCYLAHYRHPGTRRPPSKPV